MNQAALELVRASEEEFKQGLKGDSEVYRHAFRYPRELMIADMARVLAFSLPFTLLLPVMIFFKSGFELDLPDFLALWLGFFLLMALFFLYIIISSHRKMPEWVVLVLTRKFLIYYHSQDKDVDVIAGSMKGHIGSYRHLKLNLIAGVKNEAAFFLRNAGRRKDLSSFTFLMPGPEGTTGSAKEWLVPLEEARPFLRRLKELNPRIELDPALPGANV